MESLGDRAAPGDEGRLRHPAAGDALERRDHPDQHDHQHRRDAPARRRRRARSREGRAWPHPRPPTGQVAGHDDIWAGGDCSAFPKPKGGDSPQVALYAYKHGEHIGRNLSRALLEGEAPKPFKLARPGPGRIGRAPQGRRRAQGHPGHRPARVADLAAAADLLLPELGPPAAPARRLADLADRRARHRCAARRRAAATTRSSTTSSSRTRSSSARSAPAATSTSSSRARWRSSRRRRRARSSRRSGPATTSASAGWRRSSPRVARAKTIVRTLAVRRDQAPRLQEVMRSAGQLVARVRVTSRCFTPDMLPERAEPDARMTRWLARVTSGRRSRWVVIGGLGRCCWPPSRRSARS